MRVLTTGGGGFIGSHMVSGLLASGHEVRVLDLRGRNEVAEARVLEASAHVAICRVKARRRKLLPELLRGVWDRNDRAALFQCVRPAAGPTIRVRGGYPQVHMGLRRRGVT